MMLFLCKPTGYSAVWWLNWDLAAAMEPWSVSQLRELAALSGSAAMAFSHQSPVILDSWCFYMECKDIFGAPLTYVDMFVVSQRVGRTQTMNWIGPLHANTKDVFWSCPCELVDWGITQNIDDSWCKSVQIKWVEVWIRAWPHSHTYFPEPAWNDRDIILNLNHNGERRSLMVFINRGRTVGKVIKHHNYRCWESA